MSATPGIGLGIWLVSDVIQLPHAGELGVHECPAPSPMWHSAHATPACGAACHAVNCGCIGVWHACPQNDGDSIECSAP